MSLGRAPHCFSVRFQGVTTLEDPDDQATIPIRPRLREQEGGAAMRGPPTPTLVLPWVPAHGRSVFARRPSKNQAKQVAGDCWSRAGCFAA